MSDPNDNRLGIETPADFENSIIAQHDDNYYDESGYVVCFRKGLIGLANYSHCSCYDTWTALCGGGIGTYGRVEDFSFSWIGSVEDFLKLARGKMDPQMPGRVASPGDCDYDHLMEVYKQVIQYFGEGNETIVKDK